MTSIFDLWQKEKYKLGNVKDRFHLPHKAPSPVIH